MGRFNHIASSLIRYSLLVVLSVLTLEVSGQSNIVKAEYYIDSDPGINAATDIPVSAGPSLDLSFTVPTASLSRGFHTLVVRVQDETGQWSIQESRAFFIDLTTSLTIEDLTDLEYYIDTDPGIGNATPITITQGQTIDISTIISASSLSVGFHVLVVRARDEVGQWGIGESRAFYISQSDPGVQANITSIEYFIDTDPGIGNGTALPLTAAANLDVSAIIPTASLSPGFHVLYIRAQDEDGVWGIYESRSFYVDDLGGFRIAAVEYYIDGDPGIGSGNITVISPPVDSLTTVLSVPTDTMSIGTKSIGIRLQDENGIWGLTEVVQFSLCDGANAAFQADTVCIGDVTTFTDLTLNEISGDVYSWDYDGDDIVDDTFTIPALAVIPTDGAFTFSSPGLYESRLIIERSGCIDTARVQVLVNDFPVADFTTTTVCEGTPTDFTDASTLVDSNTSYRWDFQADATIDDTTVGSTAFTYPAAGSYNVELEVVNGQCSSGIINRIVDVIANPVADAGADQDICADFTQLAAAAPLSGETAGWSILFGNATFSDVTSNTADISNLDPALNEFIWSVTESNGICTTADTVAINQVIVTQADAGPDQSLCINSTTMAANAAIAGETGLWIVTQGTATLGDVNDPFSSISNIGSGTTTLVWSIEEANGLCITSDTVSIAVNNPITAGTINTNITVGGTAIIDMLTGATINGGDTITATIVTNGTQGAATISGTSLSYTSNQSASGQDRVEFEICNQCGSCSQGEVLITIDNSPPVSSLPQSIVVTGANFTLDLLPGLSDPDNNLDPASLRIIEQPISGASAGITNGQLTLDYSGVSFNGTDSVLLEVCDLAGACLQFTVAFEVNTENPPIIVYNAVTPNGDGRHDFLEIDNISFYTNNVVRVFNRWGEEVDRIEDYDNSRNVFTGEKLPAGTYFYLISLGNGQSDQSGSLILKKSQ